MIDKELEAMFKCHEYLQDLDTDSRMRVFKYLLDRYGLVKNGSNFSNTSPISHPENKIENIEILTNVDVEEENINKTVQKPKQIASNGKKNKSSLQSYNLITSLNLAPKDKKSLKDFFKEYNAKSNFEYNIVILTYLITEIHENNVGVNHLYTCYKHLGLKVPNIKQSLVDTKKRKGWIDSSNSEDLKITVSGENFMDHEIEKKS